MGRNIDFNITRLKERKDLPSWNVSVSEMTSFDYLPAARFRAARHQLLEKTKNRFLYEDSNSVVVYPIGRTVVPQNGF